MHVLFGLIVSRLRQRRHWNKMKPAGLVLEDNAPFDRNAQLAA